jgi:hypothetical protein
MGDILISDSTGLRFSKSLRDNVRDKNGQCDFERVQALKGIFIANVYDSSNARQFEDIV